MEYLGKTYEKLTNDYHPYEGEILYKLPLPYDEQLDPLKLTVTKWGAKHHGEEDNFLIQVVVEYPISFIDYIREQYKDKSRKEKKNLY